MRSMSYNFMCAFFIFYSNDWYDISRAPLDPNFSRFILVRSILLIRYPTCRKIYLWVIPSRDPLICIYLLTLFLSSIRELFCRNSSVRADIFRIDFRYFLGMSSSGLNFVSTILSLPPYSLELRRDRYLNLSPEDVLPI